MSGIAMGVERQELDVLSQQISDLDAREPGAEDMDAAGRALRQITHRMKG